MTLRDVLWIVVSGGAGGVVYWLMERVPFLAALRPDYKRYAGLALSALLPPLAWLAMVGMGYEAQPATWQGWLERAFALAAGAILVSQGAHGALKLRPRNGPA
jgi:hypothetical protein